MLRYQWRNDRLFLEQTQTASVLDLQPKSCLRTERDTLDLMRNMDVDGTCGKNTGYNLLKCEKTPV